VDCGNVVPPLLKRQIGMNKVKYGAEELAASPDEDEVLVERFTAPIGGRYYEYWISRDRQSFTNPSEWRFIEQCYSAVDETDDTIYCAVQTLGNILPPSVCWQIDVVLRK
jgi:hypothetical protein